MSPSPSDDPEMNTRATPAPPRIAADPFGLQSLWPLHPPDWQLTAAPAGHNE